MREHGTKTILVFLPADGEASWWLLPSSVCLLSRDTVQPENTYSCILEVPGRAEKNHLRDRKKHQQDILSSNISHLFGGETDACSLRKTST